MTKAKNKWMTQVEEFFTANPGREFLFREMPLDAGRRTLNAVSAARWVVGAASCTPGPLGTFGISA